MRTLSAEEPQANAGCEEMILALTIAVGTSSFWPIAWLIPLAEILRKRIKPPVSIRYFLGFTVAIVIVHVAGYEYAAAWLATVFGLIICRSVLRQPLNVWPLAVMALVHTTFILWQYFNGIERVTGLQHNASILAFAGFSLFPYGAIVAGLSLSRTVLIVTGLFALMTKSRVILGAFLLTVVLSVGVGMIVTPERYGLDGIDRDWRNRMLAITGSNHTEDAVISERINVPTVPREWSWSGYGWNKYTPSTGKVAPHNMFVLAWFEFGIISILFWAALLKLWKVASSDWRLLLTVVVIGLFTVDLYSRIEGIYVVLGLHTLCQLYPHREFRWLTPVRERIDQALKRLDVRLRKIARTGEPPGGY